MQQQPGWYPDPSGAPGRLRYWDGRTWTTATMDPASSSSPAPSANQKAPTGAPGRGPRTTAIIVTAAALVLALVGIGGFWLANRNSDTPGIDTTPAPAGPPSTMQPVPPGTSAPTNPPTMPPGEEARLDCSGGNGSFTRRWQPELSSAGIVYDAVPDWTFSFDGSYWTWLDDHTSLGDVHLDDAKNEAGITIGGLPYAAGFADQATAGERTVECLEGSLSTEERATAGTPVTVETTLGGMKTFHTRVEITDSNPKPLLVDIYVIDAAQGSKWAQVITFQRPDSSAKPLIEKAVASVRHV